MSVFFFAGRAVAAADTGTPAANAPLTSVWPNSRRLSIGLFIVINFRYHQPMRVLPVSLAAVLLTIVMLLSGCARSQITTEIKSGGAWTRTVSLTGQEKK